MHQLAGKKTRTGKIESEEDLYTEVDRCTRTVLLSSRKNELVAAIKRLQCIVAAKCICSFCDGTGDIDFVYEFMRCLVPSRTMQLIMERHLQTPRWAYLGPMYSTLFDLLYEDLKPTNTTVYSNGALEAIVCKFKLPSSVYTDTLAKIQDEKKARRIKKLRSQSPPAPPGRSS
jgi:hypothetical protein